MDIAVEELGGIAVAIILVDELDASNAGELKRDIGPILETHNRIIIDLDRVRFVDSSALGAILSGLRHMAAKGGDLKLCCLSKHVKAAFELVRLHRVFEIFSSREDAVNAFR
jgi:anti-sigma B factor antagonist